jgi:predicted PurR-regulated permease PerM
MELPGQSTESAGTIEPHGVRPGWRAMFVLAGGLALGLGFLQVIGLIARPLALLVLAITVAQALNPIVSWLDEHVPGSRVLAVLLVYLGLALVMTLVAWLVVPGLVAQAREFGTSAPDLIGNLQEKLARILPVSSDQVGQMAGALAGRVGDLVIRIPQHILHGMTDALLVLFLSIYWLITSRSIRGFTLSLIPSGGRRKRAARVLDDMGHSMGGYVRGTVINAVIMGVLAYIGMLIIGVPYALVLGVVAMLGEIVPVVGPVVVGVIVSAFALVHSVTRALLSLTLFTALEQLEGHVLTPNIMRSQTDVPQTLVLFAIIVGAAVGGLLGILVSIPVAAALRVLIIEVIAPAERRMVNENAHPS